MVETFFNLVNLVVPALIEGLWRGIVITFGAAFLIHALRLKAALRYKLWLALLILICALPFVRILITASSEHVAVQNIQLSHHLFSISLSAAAVLLCALIIISFVRLIMLAGSFFSLLKLRRSSKEGPTELQQMLLQFISQKKLNRSVNLRITSKLNSPALIGFIRPTILMPKNLLSQLNRQELRQILSHELAHLNRYDDWTILVQKILTSLFSFHPAVLWIEKRMNLEREIACDDSVIEAGEIPRSYALCLTRLAEFASTFVPATIASAGSQLSRRIDMLLNKKETQRSGFLWIVQTIGMFVFLIIACAVLINNQGLLLAVSPVKEELVMLDQTNTFESAQQRFEEARMKLEQAREEMLAAGEEMRNAQREVKDQKTGIESRMKLSLPEPLSLPVFAVPPVAPAPEARPTIAPPPIRHLAPTDLPTSVPPALDAVPELPPPPDTPPSFKRYDDTIK